MKFKKILAIGVATMVSATLFSACTPKDDGKIKIVATMFPQYDWIRNIIADDDKIELKLLLDKGMDMHNYQPTTSDIVSISTCDLFVYVGGESEQWVQNALKNNKNPNRKVINLSEVLSSSLLEEEEIEEDEDHEDHEEETEYDEHIWLSLRNAEKSVTAIAETLKKIDKENSSLYQTNGENYVAKLKALDDTYTKELSSCEKSTVVFGDRFPFLYLCKDYNIDYFAAFSGCSASISPSITVKTKLAQKLDEYELNYILTIEGSENTAFAESIVMQSSDPTRKVLTLNSMQVVSTAQINAGATYLSIMENNLSVLKTALS